MGGSGSVGGDLDATERRTSCLRRIVVDGVVAIVACHGFCGYYCSSPQERDVSVNDYSTDVR